MEDLTVKSKNLFLGVLCGTALAVCVTNASIAKQPENSSDRPFKPTIESLLQYKCPEWFRDAKFGIYIHWGVYSVAEHGEWYARRMYEEGKPTYNFHVKTYGHPSKFGYIDLIPMWKAEKFDPDAMVKLFKAAGAKYFTPCAVHHDGFDLWNSKYHRWNAVKMGPKKDIIGMFREATLNNGLHFGVTTHLARSYSWLQTSHGADKKGPLKGVPYDGANPANWSFYHPPCDDKGSGDTLNAPKAWRDEWYNRLTDLIDNYHPEFIYLDSGIPFMGDDHAETGKRLMAYYYNDSAARHGGTQQCVFTIKNRGPKRSLYVDGVATLDLERSKADHMYSDPWQTDDSIGPWGYTVGVKYKTVNCVIDKLVDIVSKNGNLLLNVPPKADGTLDEETKAILKGTGEWLSVNGEAIYETRPWVRYGEGPTTTMNKKSNTSPYTAKDIRYTASKDGKTLYAIVLDWPGAGPLVLHSVAVKGGGGKVSMLGYDKPLRFSLTDARQVVIDVPDLSESQRPCKNAYTFKLTGFKYGG